MYLINQILALNNTKADDIPKIEKITLRSLNI